MIAFKSLEPSYRLPKAIKTREDLEKLGCSPELIKNVCLGKSDEFHPLWPPEEWFWADRRRFGHGGAWVDELYQIAGGCFADLSLIDQCELLGLKIEEIRLPKSPAGRGEWMKRGDAVSLEEAALHRLLRTGEIGFHLEGSELAVILQATKYLAMARFRGSFDLETLAGMKPATDEQIEKWLIALDILLERPHGLSGPLWERLRRATKTSLENVLLYIERAGATFVRSIAAHCLRHGLKTPGHPDLTIIGSNVRFVEVKATDKLYGTQACWMRDVARPLGLPVSVVRVKPE